MYILWVRILHIHQLSRLHCYLLDKFLYAGLEVLGLQE